MPGESAVRKWAVKDPDFGAQYARARDTGLDAMADRVLAVASRPDLERTNRDRLEFDALRWYLSKLAPKRYGERLTTEHTGSIALERKLDLSKLTDDEVRMLHDLAEKASKGASE